MFEEMTLTTASPMQVEGFFDPGTWTVSYLLLDARTGDCALIDSVLGLGTEASECSKLAPCLIYGPGHISCAHMPTEYIEEEQFYNSIETFRNPALHLV
jgi:acetylornithine deacetylase/succinyl-diaminopimelate desuccinylase-like protein